MDPIGGSGDASKQFLSSEGRMNLVALVFGILALLHIWTDSLVDIKPNFSSGKVILMASNTDLEANFFSLPSSKSPGPREGVLYVAEPLDACQKLSNKPEQSPNGISPFVLIARGGCNFKEKVENVVRAGFKAFIVHDDVHRDILVPGRVMFSEANNSKIKIDHAAFVSKANGETLSKYVGVGHINASVLLVPRLNKPEWWIFIVSFLIGVGAALAACIFLLRQASRNL
ncbi:hypothetical protein Rs2_01970 [Raphanus sativus]|nr:hypothetical protein Rs2_01970 [Raphanus sativus]